MKTWCARIRRRLLLLNQLRTPHQWWLFARIFIFATTVPALFRLRLSVLNRILERPILPAGPPEAASAQAEQIIRCVEIVRAVGRPLVRPKCLTRACTLYYFLRRAGMELTLCFGAARKEGQLVADAGHCWLMKNGEPFLETQDPRANFAPFFSLPHSMHGTGDPRSGRRR